MDRPSRLRVATGWTLLLAGAFERGSGPIRSLVVHRQWIIGMDDERWLLAGRKLSMASEAEKFEDERLLSMGARYLRVDG